MVAAQREEVYDISEFLGQAEQRRVFLVAQSAGGRQSSIQLHVGSYLHSVGVGIVF